MSATTPVQPDGARDTDAARSIDGSDGLRDGRAATHAEAVASGIVSGRRLREPLTLTALFDDRRAVDRALDALYAAGTPRDLVEVVVSGEAAKRHYADAARSPRQPGRETFRYAGIGGLLGFCIGVVIGVISVAMPGIHEPGDMALVQMLGPNMATIGGATLGAVYGFFRRQQPDPRHARAAEETGAIVLAVATRGDAEAAMLSRLIEAQGARGLRVE